MTTTKIPRHAGDHRAAHHRSFRDIYQRTTGKVWDVLHYDRRSQTDVIPAVGALLPAVEVRVAEIRRAFPGVLVTVDPDFVPTECRWCMPERPELATVRVTGSPAKDDVDKPLQVAEAHHRCVLGEHGPIRQALIESASDNDIRVEVCE